MCAAFSSFGQSWVKVNNAGLKKLFDEAVEVKLLSYLARYEYVDAEGAPKEDTVYFVAKNLRIPSGSIKETITLSVKQRDALLMLLMPHISKGKGIRDVLMCYDPRHAIIFYDANAQPTAYIELCLECGNYEMSPGLYLEFYSDNTAVYKKLFKSFGVKYLGPEQQ